VTQADSDLPIARKPRAKRAPRAAHGTRTGPRAVIASDVARRTASLILEALTGVRTTQEAADALGVALPRYYVLETRALSGLVGALEPRSRGRQRGAAEHVLALEADVARLERELRRFQALQRASQRALGLGAPAETPAAKLRKAAQEASNKAAAAQGKKPKRKRKPNRATRAERIAKSLTRGLAQPLKVPVLASAHIADI
jgi:hypothetical protein